MLKPVLIAILILVSFSFQSYSNSHPKSGWIYLSEQDSLWKEIDSSINRFEAIYQMKKILNQFELDVLREGYRDKIRSEGLIFWRNYPNDIRRGEWFLWTVSHPPSYYNAGIRQLDTEKRNSWEKIYPDLKKEYMASIKELSLETAFRKKAWFNILEMKNTIADSKFSYQITGKKFDLNSFTKSFIELAKDDQKTDFFVPLLMIGEKVVNENESLGISEEQVISFLELANSAKIPELTDWLTGKRNILKFKKRPLDLFFITYDGKKIGLDQMKGKVVLIDFWATWCGSCLEYMPVVRDLYLKYRSKGFEVFSISINKNSEKEQVLSTEKNINAGWPLAIIGNSKVRQEIWTKFQFNGIPQLLLIDKNGMLMENNGKLKNKNTLEEMIKQAL